MLSTEPYSAPGDTERHSTFDLRAYHERQRRRSIERVDHTPDTQCLWRYTLSSVGPSGHILVVDDDSCDMVYRRRQWKRKKADWLWTSWPSYFCWREPWGAKPREEEERKWVDLNRTSMRGGGARGQRSQGGGDAAAETSELRVRLGLEGPCKRSRGDPRQGDHKRLLTNNKTCMLIPERPKGGRESSSLFA